MSKNSLLYFLTFFVVLISSCNPDEDTIDPVIEYLEPDELVNINLPDTIVVKAKVSDDQKLTMIILNLLDVNKIPCATPQYFYPNTNDFQLNTSIILEDINMSSGTYELQIFASDGENTKFKYRSVIIKTIPLEIEAYIAITEPLTFRSIVTGFNSDFILDTQFVVNQAHWLSNVSSLWGQFFFISDDPSVITSYQTTNFEPYWENGAAPPRPVFTDIFVDKELLFGTANGDAGILNEYGTVVLRTPVYENYTVKHVAADENYIYVAHRSLDGALNRLTVFYRPTGILVDQPQLSVEIAGLVPVNGYLAVFTHLDEGFGIMEYDPRSFTLTGICSNANDSLVSVEKVSDNEMILVTKRCVIDYEYLNCRFTDFTSEPYDFCRYDELKELVYLAKENSLYAFGLESGTLNFQHNFSDKLVDFQILYNK